MTKEKSSPSTHPLLTIVVLVVSTWAALAIGSAVPMLGNSIAAIIIGATIRHTPLYHKLSPSITHFVSSHLLKAGIVLLGFTLSLRIIREVGMGVLALLAVGVVTSLLISILLAKMMDVDSELGLLVGIGTSICGGSAIVATAPIMQAKNRNVAISITTMLIFSLLALLVLPLVGQALSYSDQAYGVLAGAGVNDVASVVATSFDWSQDAGAFATVTKLTRVLYLVPLTLGLIAYQAKRSSAQPGPAEKRKTITAMDLLGLVPLYVILFIGAVIFASIVHIPDSHTHVINAVSKALMTIALVTIGLGVHVKEIKAAGIKPVIIGGCCWAGVVINAIIFIHFLY